MRFLLWYNLMDMVGSVLGIGLCMVWVVALVVGLAVAFRRAPFLGWLWQCAPFVALDARISAWRSRLFGRRAVEVAMRMRTQNPRDSKARYNLGVLYMEQRRWRLAIEELRASAEINPDRSDAYNVLGQLYRELPGVISFGNVDYAVSLGREARDLRASQFASGTEKDLQYNFVTELAKSLHKRNWTAAARASGQKTKASKAPSAKTPEEKAFFYEGTVTLPSQSDREEALALAKWVVSEIERRATRTAQMEKDLVKAQDVLKEWQGS